MGIKVESDMLVLDNTFTKEDVQAINEYVKINVDKERERIIQLIKENKHTLVDLWEVIRLIERNTDG